MFSPSPPSNMSVTSFPMMPLPVTARTFTPGPTIAFVNDCTVMSDAQIATIVAALQIQVDQDFAPIWKIDANLLTIPKGQTPPSNAWIMYIMDTSNEPGALGYHDLTPLGNPIGKVFVKDDMKYGLHVSVTMSHELLEMLIDPQIQNCAFIQETNTTGLLYAYEICDACEADNFGKEINGVLVSDWVYPSWFEAFRAPNSTKFDHHGALNAPLQLAAGGYIGVFGVGSSSTNGWVQKTAESTPSQRMLSKGPYSRFNRRMHKLDK